MPWVQPRAGDRLVLFAPQTGVANMTSGSGPCMHIYARRTIVTDDRSAFFNRGRVRRLNAFPRVAIRFIRATLTRARAILLSLDGWSSLRIAEAFSVKPDSLRHWRWTFGREGISGLRARTAPGPQPVKARAALSVVTAVLSDEVSDRPNWTLPRLQDEVDARTGQRISKSRLSVVMRKRGLSLAAAAAHAEGTAGRRTSTARACA